MDIHRQNFVHSTFTKFSVSVLFCVFSLVLAPFAQASVYLPGETLEPDCAPGASNCGVLPIGDANTGAGAPALVSPDTGALYLDTVGGTFFAYDGSAWVTVSGGAGLTSLNGQTGTTQTFAIGTSGTDVSFASAANVHTLNIPDASALNRGLVTTGTQLFAGAKTFGDGLTIIGDYARPMGTDFATTGVQNDVDLGTGSFFRYTGVSEATITGFAGGVDGQMVRITNASSSNLTIRHQNTSSVAANRIIIETGLDAVIPPNSTFDMQYDSGASRWRVAVLPTTASLDFAQGGNSFGAIATIGTTDAYALDLITGGATRFALAAGASTLTGTGSTTLTSTGALALSSAAASTIGITTGTTGTLTIDTGTTGAINFGNGANSKIITIGNTSGTTALNLNSGSSGISLGGNTTITGSNAFTTGTGITTINSTGITLAGNSTVINMTGTGTLSLNTTTNRAITTGTGLFTVGGDNNVDGSLTIAGNLITPHGVDFTTTGTVNNANFGIGALIRYTGASPVAFTGILAGTDGQLLTLMNAAGANTITLKNEDAGSSTDNRIITGTLGDLVLPEDTTVMLQYEIYNGYGHWHVLSPPSNVANILTTGFIQGGNSFGATEVLGSDDFYGLNLQTGGVNALTLDTSGNGNLTGDLTVTGGDISTPAVTAMNLKTGTTGVLTLDSGTTGDVNLGTGANAKIITIGNNVGATALHLDAGSGGINIDGNVTFTDGNSFSSGSGAFSVIGNFITPKGTDYSSTGTQNNVNFGSGMLFRFTGGAPATVTGIAGGTDGRQIRITNVSSSNIVLTNQDSGSLAANRIATANGESATIGTNGSISLQYDSGSLRWRVTALPVEAVAIVAGGNSFNTALNVGTTDGYPLNLITNNVTALSLDTSGNANLTGDLTVTGGDVLSAATVALNVTSGSTGVLTLDSGTTGAVNLGTGANAKTVTVGNTTTSTTLNLQSGTGGISLQVAGTGAIGNVQIGVGSGSATPDLFVLDLKNNSSADPVGGTNGASYYNTTSSKFRCYEGGGWKDCDTTGGTTTLQSAYTAGPGITTGSSADFALTLTSGNFTATGTGAVLLTPTAASSFTSADALTFTAGATSTWGTTAGDLKLQVAGTGTTAYVQIGAGSTGSATPDLLVLDTKSAVSGSGDPSGGTPGASYYNIASSKFRCYEGVAWKDCDTGGGAGLTSLNGEGGASQTLVIGTTGTDFNIVSGSGTHTFNIPDASVTNRGLVTTGAQTLAGNKTFSNDLLVNGLTTLGNATGDSVTVNGSTVTFAGNSTVIDMTGTGILSLNTVTNRAISTGTGLFTTGGGATINGDLTYTGALINTRGSDFSVTGTQNNLNLGAGTWFRFTGASQITITGIANPVNGKQIRLTNASASSMIFSNQDVSSTDVNRIITTTGGNLVIDPDVTATFQYDSTAQRWRLVILPASSGSVSSFAYIQGGNGFGTAANFGTTDAYALNLKTNGSNALVLDTSGNGNLTGDLTVTGGDIASPSATSLNVTAGTTGVLTLDSGSTGAINLGTGASSKTITIGNTTGTTAVNINAGSNNVTLTAGTTNFQTSTATNDELALTPSTGGGASFTGTLTSTDLTGSAKT